MFRKLINKKTTKESKKNVFKENKKTITTPNIVNLYFPSKTGTEITLNDKLKK